MPARIPKLLAAAVVSGLLFMFGFFHYKSSSLPALRELLEPLSPRPSSDHTTATATLLVEDANHLEATPEPRDKVIVIARMQEEDTSWVAEELPYWQNAIYVVDNTSAPLHTSRNKGREANVYLLYIIEHYHSLPSTIVFIHPTRKGYPAAWHNDVADYDNVIAMNVLRIPFVQQNGYVNLRCNWNPGCPEEVQYLRSERATDSQNVEHQLPMVWRHFFGADGVVPEVLATPCCAQLAVSREQVLKRDLKEYKKFHQWLMNTPLDDAVSGRIFEYLWHVIFGKDPVYCPAMHQCYQDVYGR